MADESKNLSNGGANEARNDGDFVLDEAQLTILLDSVEGALIEEQQKVEFLKHRETIKRLQDMGELEDPTLNFTFSFADQNGDGLMSAEELQSLLRIPMEKVNEIMQTFDQNEDGFIDVEEFEAFVENEESQNFAWVKTYKKSKDWMDQFVEEHIKDIIPTPKGERPWIFVSYGPQGSGKTSATNKYIKKLGITPVEVNIDDITKRYAAEVIGDETLTQTNELYWKIRKGWPTICSMTLISVCEERRLPLLKEATGRKIHTWEKIEKLVRGPNNYRVVVIYVLVPYIFLIQRVLARFKATGQGYCHFTALCKQVKDAAENSNKWFKSSEDGGFVYFNNCLGMGEETQLESAEELHQYLQKYPFMKFVRNTVKWRPVSQCSGKKVR